jgi:hypothetical protein
MNWEKYTEEQKEWCKNYQDETRFEPLMDDFEAGKESFYKAATFSLTWFESWSSDALLRAYSKNGVSIPGWEEDNA